MWLIIKSNPSCKHGAKQLWLAIQRFHFHSNEPKLVVDQVLQLKALRSFGNIRWSMSMDKHKTISELAMRYNVLAKFERPKLNFNAKD